ncbi:MULTISPECIES: tetratricopeptide repeat protein [unclassified Ruegeria]|uniref:tetratricopeptide repeat protein n=1 Tax=unclassified Ruegeria TaxID=2625375 RepID=UPI0014879F74|nr:MULTISPECIES: hypothetical protein [unclassified Ruegeria]
MQIKSLLGKFRVSSFTLIIASILIAASGAVLQFGDKHREIVRTCNLIDSHPQDAVAACDTLLKWSAVFPTTRSLIHRHKLRAFMQLKDWDSARAEAELAIRETPNSYIPWGWKAFVLVKTEDYAEAMVAVDRALELQPNDAWSLQTKVKLLSRINRHDEILPFLEDAIEHRDAGVWAWNRIGRIHLYQKDHHRAALAFAEAIRTELDSSYARRKLFEACILAGSDCPALFPEDRAGYETLSCKVAGAQWLKLYPKLSENPVVIDYISGAKPLHGFSDPEKRSFQSIMQVVYLGSATSMMQQAVSTEVAEKHIVHSKMFDCVNDGQFVFPLGIIDEAEREHANTVLFGSIVRQNLIDIAQARLARSVGLQK